MPYCAYIPRASLSAVIISAVIFMVDYHVVKPLWRSSSKIQSLAPEAGFVAQKLVLSYSFRCYRLQNDQIHEFGHTLMLHLKWNSTIFESTFIMEGTTVKKLTNFICQFHNIKQDKLLKHFFVYISKAKHFRNFTVITSLKSCSYFKLFLHLFSFCLPFQNCPLQAFIRTEQSALF